MSLSQKEKALQAIRQFILQRDKKTKERTTLLSSLENEWTMTQLHIVSLIQEHSSSANNAFLACQLRLSKPAITKAVNGLLEKGIVVSGKKEDDQKCVYYSLTEAGQRLAFMYDEHHQKVIQRYEEMLNSFQNNELEVITRFMNTWTQLIDKPLLVDEAANATKGDCIED
ncbi:MarR family transcriptional regulator [Brevibacillus reuszeri]|uniref:MarR family transcriptional regulator n=1 Tax=Brevibacillus reuszeri TaxID=54915 RepID=UPI00289DE93A|nr:MarR family transcriptional regulator [Brevibacillus reuszeri]